MITFGVVQFCIHMDACKRKLCNVNKMPCGRSSNHLLFYHKCFIPLFFTTFFFWDDTSFSFKI